MFYVLLTGAGEGCDYTIGCNKTWKQLKAATTEEAVTEVATLVVEEYASDEHRLEKATILSVDGVTEFNCRAEYQRVADEKARQQAILDKQRRQAEYERLQREFGSCPCITPCPSPG